MAVSYRVSYFFFKFFIISSFLFSKTSFPGFDIFSSSLSLGMGGAGYLITPSPSYTNINPSMYRGKIFSSSIIRYPASVTNHNLGIALPIYDGFGNFSINHLSYGIIEGYDEDLKSTGTFNASDTRLTTGYSVESNKYPLSFGVSSNFFISNYSTHKFFISTLNMGLNLSLEKYKTFIGVSIHDFGKEFGNLKIDFDPKFVFSSSKQLTHLPLVIYADWIIKKNSISTILIGGEFQVSNKLQFRFGTSTKKFDQNMQNKIINTILGSTGFGASFTTQNIYFHYGIFLYGTGALINGLEIEIVL